MSSSSPNVAGFFETLGGRLKTERDVADFFNRTIAELVAPHHLTRFWGDRLLTSLRAEALVAKARARSLSPQVSDP